MENHSYQKCDVDMLLAINDEIGALIQEVLNAVDSDKYSYKQKETALHVVNEILFHKLITDSND